jgi:hypothetical protein
MMILRYLYSFDKRFVLDSFVKLFLQKEHLTNMNKNTNSSKSFPSIFNTDDTNH